jgi:hypothetical protein
MDQLQPPIFFHSAPPPVAPSPQLFVDAGPAHATYTVPMSTPREPVMSASREPHPLLPNDAPRAFTTVRMPSALCISLAPVPASLARTTPATFRISSPTQSSVRSSSQTASTLHCRQFRILPLSVSTKQRQCRSHYKLIESAHKEIKSLEEKHTWREVDLSEAKTKIVPGTRVFCRERTPKGIISKHKGR